MIKDIVNGLIETYKTTNPFEICDYLDIKVINENLGNEIKGFFQRTTTGYELIHLNSTLTQYELKYVCAHELGHALLHTDLSIGFFIENTLQVRGKYELQADKFAAELILPDKLNSEFLEYSMEQLSSYFGVPQKLINYKYKKE